MIFRKPTKYLTMNKTGNFLLLLLAFFLTTKVLQAQGTTACLGFESLDPGTEFGSNAGNMPGDLLVEENTISAAMQGFFPTPSGPVAFGNGLINTAPVNFTLANGQAANLSNISLQFDFSGIPGQIIGVSFTFFDGGGIENVQVNDGPLKIVQVLSQLNGDVAPGVEASVASLPGAQTGLATLTGPVETLLIGGQELWIDNVCATYVDFENCAITEVEIVPLTCNGQGKYNVWVNFQVDNPNSAQFLLTGNGNFYGQFEYADLPVVIGPFFGDGFTVHELVIQDFENPDCQFETLFGPVDCASECVQFEELEAGATYGFNNGYEPGDFLFSENDVPFLIQNFLNANGGNQFGNLLVTNQFNLPPVIDGNSLILNNVGLSWTFDSLAFPVGAVRIGFLEGGGDVNLSVNGEPLAFANDFSQLPQQIAPGVTLTVVTPNNPPSNPSGGYLLLEGPIHSVWIGGQELVIDNICYYLQGLDPACEIGNVTATPQPCLADGAFFIELDFDFAHIGNLGFKVQGNGVFYGQFDYADLPITLGPFPSNGQALEFGVTDLEFPDCHNFVEIQALDCEATCIQFEGLQPGFYNPNTGYQPGDIFTDEDGVLVTLQEFVYDDSTTGFFGVQVGSDLFGDLPYFTNNEVFISNTSLLFDFTGLPEPVTAVTIAFADGGGEENFSVNGSPVAVVNSLFDLLLLNIPGITIEIETDPTDPIPVHGYLHITGNIETLLLGGQEFVIDNVCFTTQPQQNCEIFDLVVESSPCNADGLFFIDLEFQYANVGDGGFLVLVNNQEFGPFSYNELPLLELGPFEGNGQPLIVKVYDENNPACFQILTILAPDCNTPCSVFNLTADLLQVTADGYIIQVDFDYENPPTDVYLVYFNGDLVDDYMLNVLPATFFVPCNPNNSGFVGEVKVCIGNDTANPCCETTAIELPPCQNANCEIFDLVAEVLPCTPNGVFSVVLDFEYANVGGQGFKVVGNGQNYGTFQYTELPITIGALPGNGTTVYEFIVMDLVNPNCMDVVEVGPVDCEQDPCSVTDLSAVLTEQTPDGYFIEVNFNYNNAPSPGFLLYFNGELINDFPLNELPVTFFVPCSPNNTAFVGEVKVCLANSTPDPCCETTTIELPPCDTGGECHIFDLVAEVLPCTPNGVFSVVLNFQYDNVGNDGFQVVGNGQNYGTFDYADLPVTIGPLVGDGSIPFEFVVKDVNNPDCSDFIEIGPVDCQSDPCVIEGLTAEVIGAGPNGYTLLVDFDYSSPAGATDFEFYFEGQFIGNFPLNELPLEIEVPCADDLEAVVKACIENAGALCCADLVISLPPCSDDCYLWDLVYEISPCNDLNQVFITFDFNHVNTGASFTAALTGLTSATYQYSQLPLTLGPLPADGATIYKVKFRDNTEKGCSLVETIGTISCGDDANVWPGDADNDNIARNTDLLNLGIAFGAAGPARVDASDFWAPMPAEDWSETFDDDLNFKFADCNGDGVVDALDAEAILGNYNLTHGPVNPMAPPAGDAQDPPLFVDLPTGANPSSLVGQPFELPIILGTAALPVEDIYGIAFTIEFPIGLIDPSNVDIAFQDSWLGQPGVDLLTLKRVYPGQGRIDIALVRTDQVNTGGFGQIAAFIGIIDDVLGKNTQLEIEISQIRAILVNETEIPLYPLTESIDLSPNQSQTILVEVYPNPVMNWLYLKNHGDQEIDFLEIRDWNGIPRMGVDKPADSIPVADLEPGLYWVRIQIGAHWEYHKFVKM